MADGFAPDPEAPPRRVLCLGNELVSDDGVGLRVGRVLRSLALPSDVEVALVPAVSLDLLELIHGVRHLVVVDATTTGSPAGTLHRLALDAVTAFATPPYCCHALGLPELLQLVARLAPDLPVPRVTFVGIEAAVLDRFGTELSPSVAAAVPEAVAAVLEILNVRGAVPAAGGRDAGPSEG
jgi:hydrogenase maturation protease